MSIVATGNRSEKERQAMEAAEDARENFEQPSFCAELFNGNFRFDQIYPFPEQDERDKQIGDKHVKAILSFLEKNHDPLKVEETKLIPDNIVKGLGELGAFGLKIPQKYGGLGLSQTNYNRVIHAVSTYCASTAVLLSAHQSIGVPQPLKMFGTEEQKKKWLPRLAKGEVSAFALTEHDVGSDPAQMKTTATPTEDGKHYILNGEKLWTTNGTVATILVVMATTPPKLLPNGQKKKQITAFIVEKGMPGFEIVHRCDFMGLKGIQNGVLRFKDVKVPKENVLWEEGKGLKLALITLNTGRLTLPAACTAAARASLQINRTWAAEREQWGAPIGKHEMSAARLQFTAGGTYSMEALSKLSSGMQDEGKADIRIEASLAKLYTTGLGWRVVDQTLQLRGGRGYETAQSLKERGEDFYPVEKMMRDFRINTIIEGTSDIQRLFVSREALDRHLKLAFNIFNPKASFGEKLKTFIKASMFYAVWYPKQWLHWSYWPRFLWAGSWESKYLRYINRMSHRVARTLFHAMVLNGPGLEKRQVTLAKIVDTAMYLFAMSAALSFYLTRKKAGKLRPREGQLCRIVCGSLRSYAGSAYAHVNIKPGKSKTVEFSKAIMNGDLKWLEEDMTDVVGMCRAKKD